MSGRVLHLIDHMGLGGAQRVVTSLISLDLHEAHALSTSEKIANSDQEYSVTNRSSIINLRCFIDVYKLVKNKNPDYIHCHMPISKIIGLLITVLTVRDTKLVFHEHGSIYRDWATYNLFIRLSDRWVTKHISVSNMGRGLLNNTGVRDEKISVIRNFANLSKYTDDKMKQFELRQDSSSEDSCFRVGFAGRITERKGWRDFIECTKYVDDVEFLMAGDGGEADLLRKMAESKENLSYIGYINDIRQLLSEIDCLVIPSYWDPNPVIFYEGLASKTPIVASRCNSLKEITQDYENCLEFDPGNSKKIAEKICKLRDNDQLRQEVTHEGYRFARLNRKSRFLDKFEKVYGEC